MVNAKEYGLSEEEAKNVKDIVPTYNLSSLESGQSAEFKILEAKPREITFQDKKSGEEKKQLVINAQDKLTKMTVCIWLSAKSLKQEFFKLATKHSSLQGLDIIVSARNYEHEKWGEVRGYSVQEVTKAK